MRFGIQMYGVNEVFRKDPQKFFADAAAMGYRLLEPAAMFEELEWAKGMAWTAEDFDMYLPMMKEYGLSVFSCFVFAKDWKAAVPGMKALAEKHGIRQFVAPCPEPETGVSEAEVRVQMEDAAQTLIWAAEELKTVNAELLLHNSASAISVKIENLSVFEWMLNVCGHKVFAQPDVGYLLEAGEDTEKFLWKIAGYVKSLHYKDGMRDENGWHEKAVGCGTLDMVSTFQFARAMEVPQLIDQDSSETNIMDDIKNAGKMLASLTQCRDNTTSTLCILDTQTGVLKELQTFDRIIEAPNWLRDGDTLLYNSDGRIFRYQISTGTETMIDSGICDNCNNDHVPSPDNKWLAVSHSDRNGGPSRIYVLPMEGGTPRLVTEKGPSYLHGWSEDGKDLAYCAFRENGEKMRVDIYAIPAAGGEEWALTENAGFNDGSEYAPDDRHIWFQSTRSGLMQAWRMERDGSNPTQMTFHERNNWFPHISPDNKKVVYISYSKDGLDATEHLPNMDVELWMMDSDGTNHRRLLSFFGGQGSINVNSWSPDSRYVALVTYELKHK